MNIHFNNTVLFSMLKNISIFDIEIGSSVYGLDDEHSDVDILHILPTTQMEMNSFMNSHHQLQFKENGVDHMFVNIHTFLRNLISGDSTINFEVIHSEKLIGTSLEFLCANRKSFYNYKIIKSYLGMAKRDIKYYPKKTGDRPKNRAIGHIIRGYTFADGIMNGNFKLKSSILKTTMNELNNSNDDVFRDSLIRLYGGLIDGLRVELNNKKDKHTLGLPEFLEVEFQKELDSHITRLIGSESYRTSKVVLEQFMPQIIELYYEANENYVNY